MTIIAAIVLVVGGIVVACIYAFGFVVVGFGMLTLAVFHYGGEVAGFVWLGVCMLLVLRANSKGKD